MKIDINIDLIKFIDNNIGKSNFKRINSCFCDICNKSNILFINSNCSHNICINCSVSSEIILKENFFNCNNCVNTINIIKPLYFCDNCKQYNKKFIHHHINRHYNRNLCLNCVKPISYYTYDNYYKYHKFEYINLKHLTLEKKGFFLNNYFNNNSINIIFFFINLYNYDFLKFINDYIEAISVFDKNLIIFNNSYYNDNIDKSKIVKKVNTKINTNKIINFLDKINIIKELTSEFSYIGTEYFLYLYFIDYSFFNIRYSNKHNYIIYKII